LLQEPDKNKKMNSSTLKELTGDTTLNVRGLYSSKCEIQLKQTSVVEANDLPNLDEVNVALSRRMDVTPFNAKAVSQEDYDNADDKTGLIIANPYYKTEEFKNEYKCVLFHLLQPYFKAFKENKYTLSPPPEAVKVQNNKYLASSDSMYDWFITKYQQCEGEYVTIKDVYDKWSCDISMTSSMSRRKKEKISSKNKLEEELTKNLFLSKYLKPRDTYYFKKKLSSASICGWKQIDENDDEIEEIDI
jgi:phage/plasmid-associated DNA primase